MGRVLKDIMVSPHASQNLVGDNAYDSDKLDSPPLSGSTGVLCHGARFFAKRLKLLSEGNDTVAECCKSRTRSAFSKRWVGVGGHNAVTPGCANAAHRPLLWLQFQEQMSVKLNRQMCGGS